MSKELTENVANNVAQREMQDLTKQWRNGTLKTGSYYIRIITGNEKSDYFEGKKFCFWSDYEVEEVLAPVPSCDQFVELTEKANQFSQMVKKVEDLEKENAELKMLLEECGEEFDRLECDNDYNGGYYANFIYRITEVSK